MDGLETKGNASDGAMRDLANGMRPEPIAPSLSAPGATNVPPRPSKKAKVFAADLPQGEDALGFEAALQPLAELAVHRDTEAPLTIGLLGGPGSGKSFALGKLLAQVDALSAVKPSGPGDIFLSPIATLKIDALALSGEPAVALAGAVYDKLAVAFPELAREAAHAVRDPQVVAREAAEQLDIGRRRLDTERQNLAELDSRRARLTETILFAQPGSQVDSFARANRAKIESRLESFGITGDAIQNYKSMLRDIAESGGTSARIGAALRSFWAFKGQTRLLVTAAILILVGLGCDVASVHQAAWLAWLHGNPAFGSTATWLGAHIGWLQILKEIAFVGAAVAIATDVWRGLRFLRPLFRGVSLLETELAERRQDLDSLYAHQTRRVDALAADVELIGRRASEAERRAASAGVTRLDQQAEPSPFESPSQKSQAERFFVATDAAIQRGWRSGQPVGAAPVPHRVLVAIDNLDCLPRQKSAELLEGVRRAFGHAGFITLIAADPSRLAAAVQAEPGRSDQAALEKWLQIPFRLGTRLGAAHYAALVETALGLPEIAKPDVQAEKTRPKAQPVAFDWSVSAEELSLLTALAPLAGQSPRAVKRFVNIYRVARSQAPENKAILAFMLALDQGGGAAEFAQVQEALATGEPQAPFVLGQGHPRLDAALASVWANQQVTIEAARRAAAAAQTFSLRI